MEQPMTQPDPPEVKITIKDITFNEDYQQLEFTARYLFPGDEEWDFEDKEFTIPKKVLEQLLIEIAEKP